MDACCINTCNKAVILVENPWMNIWRPVLQLYGMSALKKSSVQLYHVSIFGGGCGKRGQNIVEQQTVFC